jgi:hypothetical protein
MIEREINNIQELIIALNENYSNYKGSVWYRGQSNKDWSLVPGYLRLNNPPSESTLLKRFKQNAAMLINNSPKESFDWLFLMQHYGVPTRLLDWSESPLVGLYFALENNNERDVDAALWSLKPSELNKAARINNVSEEFFIPSFDDIELENYTVENLSQNQRTQLYPLATIATRNNARIQAQHGVFTIHHHDITPIEQLGNSNHVIKYVIPSSSKKDFLKQLSLLGVTRFQLFPELESIGYIIKGGLQ